MGRDISPTLVSIPPCSEEVELIFLVAMEDRFGLARTVR